MRAVVEASRVPACWLEISSAVSQSRAPERQQGIELAGGLEVLDATEGGDDALARGGAVAGVLHDLQITAGSRRFDAEEHAAIDCDTASLAEKSRK